MPFPEKCWPWCLGWNNITLCSQNGPYSLIIFRIIKILHLTYITHSIINFVLQSMAPRNASKAQSTGSKTPLRRSPRGKQDETAYVQEAVDAKSDGRKGKGKQSTVADPINSLQRVLPHRGRSKKQEEAVGLRQSPDVLQKLEGVGTRSARGIAEQERVLLERAL